MRETTRFGRLLTLLGLLSLCGGLANAAVLYSGTVTLKSTDPVQFGRLSRNSIIADWSFQEDFPGAINLSVPYFYEIVPILVPGSLDFLQISIDSESTSIFASLYDGSYDPLNPDVNYLGDEGASGNILGNPRFFQVIDHTAAASPSGSGTVVLVINETGPAAGLNSPVGVVVEGFTDTAFDDAVVTAAPEPSTAFLLGGGILIFALRSFVAIRRT